MRAALVLLLIAGCAVPLGAQERRDAPRYAGRPLVEVLQDLNRRGLRIVFSTSLVPATLRVLTEPVGAPREMLDQVLRPHRLYALTGAQGVLIVTRAPARGSGGAPDRAGELPANDQPAPTASLSGQVRDESGAPIPHAIVTVTAVAQGTIKRTTADEDGDFELSGLARGRYSVIAEHPGLLPGVIPDLLLAGGGARAVLLELKVPAVTELITIGTSNPVVDVQNATVGTNFGSAMLRDIPNQRDLFALLAQTPGIAVPRTDVGGNTAGTQSSYRAYGLSGQSITTVDGVNITSGADLIGAYLDYSALAEATVASAGNSAEIPVAGAAVTTMIKSGGNTRHGEVYADFKPGGQVPYDGTEHYAQYRDINGQIGGAFIRDRLWYFTSFRDQYTELTTGMYDRPRQEGGTQGHPFTTRATNYTVKLHHQLSGGRTLTFMTQLGRKFQPYRFGSGISAQQYPAESTARQDSRSHIGKAGYMQVIGNRATLDTSFNVYGNHFPLDARTDKTPIFDDVTFNRRGGYGAPSLSQDRRRHYNVDFTVYAARHDIRVGYRYQRDTPRFSAYGAPGPAGTAGHFYIVTTDEVPSAFWTDNGPATAVNILESHALFFQDKFQVTPKLTLNYGARFDRYRSAYPKQRFGVNGVPGPFAVGTVAPARDVVTFTTVVPRAALVYDPFGRGKTALKASWGRFATNPATSVASLVNPVHVTTAKYAWDAASLTSDPIIGAARITPAYVATRQPILGGTQLTPTTVDPDLKNSYTDEYALGAEQEIAGDVRAHVTVVRKRQKNTFGRYDRLRTASSFDPVQALDPGPDAAVGTADDRTITVWETRVPPSTTDYYLTNKLIGDTYSTIEFGLTKRMSGRWQLTSGFDWTKRTVASEFSENPNVIAWASKNSETTGWTFKASGSYVFGRGVLVSLSYNAMKGEPYGRLLTVTSEHLRLADPNRTTPLLQGNVTIAADKVGTYYLPAINIVNLRAQKEFAIGDTQRLQLMVNVFNLAGAETVTEVVEITNRAFRQPASNITGTVIRFGARYMF